MAMLFLPGFNDQAVVMVELLLPLLAAVFGASVKLMLVPELTVTVSDSFSVALSATVAIFELPGPAAALNDGSNSASAQTKARLRMSAFIFLSLPGTAKPRIRLGRPILGQCPNLGREASIRSRLVSRRDYERHLAALMSPDWSPRRGHLAHLNLQNGHCEAASSGNNWFYPD